MSGHDRARGWVYLSTLCNQGVDGCYWPDCRCRCHDADRAADTESGSAHTAPPDTEETTT